MHLKGKIIVNVVVFRCEDVYSTGALVTALRTVVTVSDNISPVAFQHVLIYLYTGKYYN